MKPPDRPTQAMDLGDLPDYWEIVAWELKQLQSLPPLRTSRLLSARAFDEAQPAGARAYIAAERYLEVARDNHLALLALLKHHGATLWAPWSLLRPAFEASFLAAWIMDPEDGRERRARGLQCEVRDAYERRKHREEFKHVTGLHEVVEKIEHDINVGPLATYRREADALGRRFDKIRQPVNVTHELRGLSFVRHQPDLGHFLVATWRLLSGYEHGLGWALLSGSDGSASASIPGGASMHLVISDTAFVTASDLRK